MPLVSVVMSVYNEVRFLREAVNSILNQTFSNFEFIIINDGATDGSLEILKSYNDERIIIVSQENMGLTKSLNKGIKLARGIYIARMDASDISAFTRLEKQAKVLETYKDISLVATWYSIIDENGKIIVKKRIPIGMDEIEQSLKRDNPICHGSVMIRKSVLREVDLYRPEFRYAQDYDLWLRILHKGFKFFVIPEFLYQKRIKKLSVIKRPEQKFFSVMGIRDFNQGYTIEKKHSKKGNKGAEMELPSSRKKRKKRSDRYIEAFYQYAIATFYWREGENSKSRSALVKALKFYPFFLRAWYRLILTFLPMKMQFTISTLVSKMTNAIIIRGIE